MICENCQKKNIIKARFCRHCGRTFTEEQRQKAYDRTIFGKIEKLEKWKSYITLEAITSHPIFKTLVLVAILVWGIFLGRSNGNQMLILENDAYQVQQHAATGEYYILTQAERVSVDLYLPQKAEAVTLQAVVDGQVVRAQTFTPETPPQLEKGGAEYYYITADYGKRKSIVIKYI